MNVDEMDDKEGNADKTNNDDSDEKALLAKQAPSKKKKKRDATSLRKAPQAPKRFRSSYICFFTAKQSEIKKELGELATVAQISKRSAQLWKQLSTEDRGFWDDVAARDKQRYLAEKASYIGPWQIPYKRAKKDPSAPKRPMSAFLHFSRGRRSKIKEKNPDMKNTEVSKILGNLWRNSTEEERRPYVENEKVERGKYKTAMSKWKEEYQKRQKVESEELEQRYYPRASLQQQHYQQHVPSQNEYAQKAIHENHAQQTLKEYPYSYFQPPSTGFAGSRQVVNTAPPSFDGLNGSVMKEELILLDQNGLPRDYQIRHYPQPSPQQNVYNPFPYLGDDGHPEDEKRIPRGNLPVIDSSLH